MGRELDDMGWLLELEVLTRLRGFGSQAIPNRMLLAESEMVEPEMIYQWYGRRFP